MTRALVLLLVMTIIQDGKTQIQRVNVSGSSQFAMTISPHKDKTVLGSPYLNPHYMYGRVVVKEDSAIETLIRYNVFARELELINEKDTMAFIKPFMLDHFILNNRKFVYSLLIAEKASQEYLGADYFEVLINGKLQLLANHYTVIENNSYSTNYGGGGGDGRDYYIHKSRLFYRPGDRSAARILLKRKNKIIDVMADHQQQVIEYIKQEKLNIRKQADLEKLFVFYNQL